MTVVNTGQVAVTGTAKVGRTLSVDNGSWTFDDDYLTYAYQWERCDAGGASCVDIVGETQATYVVKSADIGGTLRAAVTATEHVNPSPPSGDPYTDIDFSGGLFGGIGLDSVFEAYASDSRLSDWGGTDPPIYDNPGAFGLSPGTSMTHDTNQRVYLFDPTSRGLPANPNGGGWVTWQELRTTDSCWCNSSPGCERLAKASLNIEGDATFGPGGFTFGAVRWFAYDILFPYNIGGLSFQFPNKWQSLGDVHSSDSGLGADPALVRVYPEGNSHPKYATFSTSPDPRGGVGVPYINVNLIQLSDGSGNRVLSNWNVWHEVVLGLKFSSNNTGWFEVWVNGVQKAPQTARQLLDPTEGGPYFQLQNYTEYPTSYIGGATRSALCYAGFRAGLARADVQRR